MKDGHIMVVGDHAVSRRVAKVLGDNYRIEPVYPVPRHAADDPYGIRGRIEYSEPRPVAAVLVEPSGLSPEAAVPATVINGVAVGIVPGQSVQAIEKWLSAVSGRPDTTGTFSVLAMWKPLYLEWGSRLAGALENGYSHARVHRCFADEVLRGEVLDHLSSGPDMAIYVGHGRSRGWSGYRGIRWKHVIEHPLSGAVGTMIALTCDNLKVSPECAEPFGVQWVTGGRACSFLGAIGPVSIDAMVGIARIMEDELRIGAHTGLGGFLCSVDRRIQQADAGTARTWGNFRLLGNPAQRWLRKNCESGGE